MSVNPASVIECRAVSCAQSNGETLHKTSVTFAPGTFSVLTGPADCGKNLLLRALGLLDIPDDGDVLLHGASTQQLSEEARDILRNRHFGFLFAQPFLLPAFSAIENVAMPLFKISGVSSEEARIRVRALLGFAGVAEIGHTVIGQLSHFEQQRVALARALVNGPDILIAENIDGELVGEDLTQFGKLLRRAISDYSVIVLATASTQALAAVADRVIEFADGRVLRDSLVPNQGGALA
jgi:ABC-type lipoprotein export system ATPase subunit